MRRELFLRYGWFALLGVGFVNRDMCLGGGRPPIRVPPPDAGASDTGQDARLRRPSLLHVSRVAKDLESARSKA